MTDLSPQVFLLVSIILSIQVYALGPFIVSFLKQFLKKVMNFDYYVDILFPMCSLWLRAE